MIYILTTLLNVAIVAVNVPGMLEGRPLSVAVGIFCSVCVGVTATFGLVSSRWA